MTSIGSIKEVSIIGAGSWGTCIAIAIAENNPEMKVILWAYEKSVVSGINNRKENFQYLPGFLLPNNITATSSIKESVINSNAIIIATPSKVVHDISLRIGKYISEKTYLGFLTKGFCKVNHKTLTISQTIEKGIPKFKNKVVAIYGPSHAEEVRNKYHTCLNVACKSNLSRKVFVKLISNDYMQCRETDDILGVEVGGILKNPAAIAAGMISVLPKCGDNLTGALISEALKEMLRLAKLFDARQETIIDISGLGDLVATALSNHSRNRRFGREISMQIMQRKKSLDLIDRFILRFKPEEIIEKMSKKLNYLAEGAYAIEPLIELAEEHKISIPVYRSLYEVLLNKKNPSLLIETIKNPEKFEQIYLETKIQISDRKKGLENVTGHAYVNIITQRTYQKFIPDGEESKYKDKKGEVVDNLLQFSNYYLKNNLKKIKKNELNILNNLDDDNYKSSIEALAQLYVKSIIDNYNSTVSWFFLKYVQIINFIKFFSSPENRIEISGNFEKIHQINKSASMIFVSTFKDYHDFVCALYAIKKSRFPIPRFFVSRDMITSDWDKLYLQLSGGFIVDADRISNVVYRESLCEYISVMIEHGVSLLYFPQHKPEVIDKNIIVPDDFFDILLESIYKNTVEIVLIPVEILYRKNNVAGEAKKISISKYFDSKIRINFSDPIYLSDYTMNNKSENKLSEVIGEIWQNDSINNDFRIKIEEGEML